MKMTRCNRRRIIHVFNAGEANSSDKSEIVNDFHILFRVLLAAGLTFPSLNDRKPKCTLCAKIFEVIINLMALFVVVVNIFFWQRRYSSATLHLSTSLTIFLALSVRFVLYLSRRQIPRMVRNLIHLYEDITRRKPYKSMKKFILIGCFTTLLLTTIASMLDGYRIHVDQSNGEHSIEFLIKPYDTDGRYQKWVFRIFMCLVPVKMYFAYGVSVMILIFCSSVYTIAKRIVFAFHDHIKEYNRENPTIVLTCDVISSYLGYYNRITQSIAEIDNVLSPCVLLLYGLMVSGQFYTLGVFITQDTEPAGLMHNIIVFLLTTSAFLVLTLTASKVTEVSEDIKRSLQKLSEKVANGEELASSGSGDIADNYLILISILNGSHLSFTGWKMFNINRSFILTTMGVMISYGVIIVQIGNKHNST